MERGVRVITAVPDNLVRFGLHTLVERDATMTIVGDATDYVQVALLCKEMSPDVLLLYLPRPEPEWTRYSNELHLSFPALRIIVLTSLYHQEHFYNLLRAGVSGYIVTTDPVESILYAIRTVMLGGAWFSPTVMEQISGTNTPSKELTQVNTLLASLTVRELQVLRLLAHGRSNRAMSHTLNISERAVRFHIRNLYDKLHLSARGEAIVWAIKAGVT